MTTLTTSQIKGLSAAAVTNLSASQTVALSATQINSLSKVGLGALNAADLTASQVSGLSGGAIGHLSNAQIATLISSQLGAFSPSQIQALTAAQLNSLGQANIQSLDVTTLTTSQIKGLSAAQINAMSTSQIAEFSQSQVQALTGAQLTNMSAVNFAVLNLVDLSAAQFKVLKYLTPGEINTLDPSQVNSLTAAQISSLSTAALNALSTTEIAALSTTQLAALSASQTASLLANHADNLSIAQISAFKASQLSTTTLVGDAGGLQFNLSWDSSVANAPAGFRNAAVAAAADLSATFNNHVVLNVHVGYGEVGGSGISANDAAQSGSYFSGISYPALVSALQGDAGNSTIQAIADTNLSASNPTNGGTFDVSAAQAKALGLAGSSSQPDGYVGLSSALSFEYNQTAITGKYDAIGAFQHEFTEVMGRVGSVGADLGHGVYTALDLFRYTSTNNADPTAGTPERALTQQSGNTSYFSIDGGTVNLGDYNPSIGPADYADWNTNMGTNSFGDAFTGVIQKMSGNDVTEMAAIGWNMTSRATALADTATTYAEV